MESNDEGIALPFILALAKKRGVTPQQVAREIADFFIEAATERKLGEKQEKIGLPVERFGVIPLD